jgi:PAS domain S-box-containing protein
MTQNRAEEDAARLAAIVEGAEDAIIGKSLDGIVTSWNHAAEAMFGHPANEILGRPVTLIIPPTRLEEEREILRRLRNGELIQHFETERVTRDGRLLNVSLSLSPIRDRNGRITGASTIARDITERRRTEQRLTATIESLEVLYRLVDQISRARDRDDVCQAAVDAILGAVGANRASVLVFDAQGLMRFVCWRGLSDAYRRATEGHSPWARDASDATAFGVEDVSTDERMAGLREVILAEGIRSLGFVPLVFQGRLLGKFMVYFDAPHSFTPHELRLAATIAQHVSFGLSRVESDASIAELFERERAARREADAARADAERANQAKDEFLAMLAHELRNPLSVIVNAVSLLEHDGSGGAPDDRAVGMIGRQADHLAHLIDDLLDVARITSGRIELERELVDLRTAVGLALDAHRHRVEDKQQRLSVTLPEHPVMVLGDSVRLQQVLGNLMDNALKYTAPGGPVAIGLFVEGEHAVVRVADEGAGIAKAELGSIFELFFQANPTLARTEGGLGIGLTLVKRVVDLHGGQVTAHSEGRGKGSVFTVRLPLAAEAAPARPSRRPVESATRRRILVVEDHEDGRLGLVALLQRRGHEVFQAATGAEGLEAAAAHAPDIVLLDIGLPDLEGYEVGRRIRETLGAGVCLIALTGYGQPKDRARSEEAGFDAHLVKPIDPQKLADTIDRLARPASV